MAESGYEKLGKSRRRVIRRDKNTRTVSGGLDFLAETLDTAAGALVFGKGQMKKQDTAWKEYEAGYEALGGDVADIPKRDSFWKQTGQTIIPGGDKGFYEMPEGDVMIDRKMYDREKIQSAGSFLGTDAAAALFSREGGDAARTRYLERAAPGRWDPSQFTKPAQGPKIYLESPQSTATPSVSGVVPPTSQIPTQDYKQIGRWDPWGESAVGGTDYSMQGVDERSVGQKLFSKPFDRSLMKGQQETAKYGEHGSFMNQWKSEQEQLRIQNITRDTTVPLPEDMSGINIASKRQQYLQRLGEGDKRMKEPGTYSFARGGDFITNGPQEILVGYNPGGRERVTIIPLSSKNDEEYKKRNLLESLYENNRRRKVY